VCQIDRLQRKSHHQALEAIKSLPKTIWETYETILLEIPDEDWHTARTALRWIMGTADLPLGPGRIRAICVSDAVLKQGPNETHAPSDIQAPSTCHEHDFLKDILGCLIELVDSDVVDPHNHQMGVSYFYDIDSICSHEVSLAHYTIQEFLFSHQVKTSRVRYFAMSQDDYAQEILETALPKCDGYRSQIALPERFHSYCDSIARCCAKTWEAILIRDEHFQERHFRFFVENLEIWHTMSHPMADDFAYCASNDPMVLRVQYLLALYNEYCVALAENLFQKLDLETTLCTTLPGELDYAYAYRMGPRSSRTILGWYWRRIDLDIRDGVISSLLRICGQGMEPSQFLIHLLCAHDHDSTCEVPDLACVDGYRDCPIAQVLRKGANANYIESTLRPLQVAVQFCDYAAVKILLEYGADVNGTGHLHGYSPAHLETEWFTASPLHIVRNAKYWFMGSDSDEEDDVRAFSQLFLPKSRNRPFR
jgi:hypothetical protein